MARVDDDGGDELEIIVLVVLLRPHKGLRAAGLAMHAVQKARDPIFGPITSKQDTRDRQSFELCAVDIF
jgi:hypothetical protein